MQTKRFTIKAYLIALLTLALGIMLSMKKNDWSWLSRSGSLIVINGIILTSHQIIEHMQILKQRQINFGSQFNRDWAQQHKKQIVQSDDEVTWKLEKYGLYMLIFGTVVWGFGDLINLFTT